MVKKKKKKKNSIIRNGTRHIRRNGRKCWVGSLEDGLQSMVLKFPLPKENGERYIHICGYENHMGIALRPEVCNLRKCTHYHKPLISELTQVYKTK